VYNAGHGDWYVPLAQLVHSVAPKRLLYVPAAHVVHTLDSLAPATFAYVPAAQSVQGVVDTKKPGNAFLYVPAEQGRQLVWS